MAKFGLRSLDGIGETADAVIHPYDDLELETNPVESNLQPKFDAMMETSKNACCCCSSETNWIKMGLVFVSGAVLGHILSEVCYKKTNKKEKKEED